LYKIKKYQVRLNPISYNTYRCAINRRKISRKILKSTLIRINWFFRPELRSGLRAANNRLNVYGASSNAGPIKGREVSGGYLSFVRFEGTPLSPVPLIKLHDTGATVPLFRNDALVMAARRGILRDKGRKPSAAHNIGFVRRVYGFVHNVHPNTPYAAYATAYLSSNSIGSSVTVGTPFIKSLSLEREREEEEEERIDALLAIDYASQSLSMYFPILHSISSHYVAIMFIKREWRIVHYGVELDNQRLLTLCNTNHGIQNGIVTVKYICCSVLFFFHIFLEKRIDFLKQINTNKQILLLYIINLLIVSNINQHLLSIYFYAR